MKRKITKLEEGISKYGFHLIKKTYRGKQSQFTKNYVFRGWVLGKIVDIYLDRQRQKVDYIYVKTLKNELDEEDLKQYQNVFYATQHLITLIKEDSLEENQEFIDKYFKSEE